MTPATRTKRVALAQQRWRDGWPWSRLGGAHTEFARADLRAVCRETGVRLDELDAVETMMAGRSPPRKWTASEVTQLILWTREGVSRSEIARRLGRDVKGIHVKLDWWQENADRIMTAAADRAKAKRRACLTCSRDFPSEGPHNRICSECRDNGPFTGLATRATAGVRVV